METAVILLQRHCTPSFTNRC